LYPERLVRGEQHHMTYLTEDQVRQIRMLYVRCDRFFGGAALARKFGTTKLVVSRIVRGICWKHVK
jgi:hypothetical protein